jgi:arabinogalactan oligomer / maltooligosaccharide transport system substrate-binding protein
MRIRTVGVLAVFGLALLASGCGGDKPSTTPTAKAGGKLVIWSDDKRAEVLKSFKDKFEKDNGVTVDVQAISKDQQTTFVTASQQGSGPDVMVGAHDWIGNLVQNGAIDPIQITDAQKASFPDVAIKAMTFGGQVYGMPYAIENVALIRNTELVPNAPATMEELVSTGKALKAAGKASEILCLESGQKGDAYHIYPLYTSGGGYLFGTKANGDYDPKDLGVGKPGSIAAFQKIAALGEKGEGALKRSIEGANSIATFTGKKCAFLVSGPWAVTDIKKGQHALRHLPGPRVHRWQAGSAIRRRAGVLRGRQGQEQGVGAGVRDELPDQAGAGRGALQSRASPAGARRRVGAGQGERRRPGQVPRRGQGRRGAAGHSRDGDHLGALR